MTQEINNNTDRLVDRKTAASILGFSPNSLAVWDCTKRYDLKPVKIGRSVRYRMSVLKEFMNGRMLP